MKPQQRRYRQLAGFPGLHGVIEEKSPHGPKPVKPLTEAERAESARAGIPHDPQPPQPYTPPLGPHTRRIGIELLGPLGLAAIVLFLFAWQMSIPAPGEQSYYELLAKQELAEPYHGAVHAEGDAHGDADGDAAHGAAGH